MAQPPFEILEHTADVGIVAHGASLEEIFANAAAGMFALMADPDGGAPLGGRGRARARGERIDRERHRLHFGVKAVTRHMLEVVEEDGGYRAQVLFDI